jgi:hypothetical protein
MNIITSVTLEGEIESTLKFVHSLRGKQKEGEIEREKDR